MRLIEVTLLMAHWKVQEVDLLYQIMVLVKPPVASPELTSALPSYCMPWLLVPSSIYHVSFQTNQPVVVLRHVIQLPIEVNYLDSNCHQ